MRNFLSCGVKKIVVLLIFTLLSISVFSQKYTLKDFENFGKLRQLIYDLPEYKSLDTLMRDNKVFGLSETYDYYPIDSSRLKIVQRSDTVRCQIGVHHGMNADTDNEPVYNFYYSLSQDSIIKIENLRK
jgi:hypothetical protein